MIGIYRRLAESNVDVATLFLAALIGIALGLTVVDLGLALVLMGRALKETTP